MTAYTKQVKERERDNIMLFTVITTKSENSPLGINSTTPMRKKMSPLTMMSDEWRLTISSMIPVENVTGEERVKMEHHSEGHGTIIYSVQVNYFFLRQHFIENYFILSELFLIDMHKA